MARRIGPEAPLEEAWEARSSASGPEPRSKAAARIAFVTRHLVDRELGLSFTELRAASGLTTEDLRERLEVALREGHVRRIGAGNKLRYLWNPVAPSPSGEP